MLKVHKVILRYLEGNQKMENDKNSCDYFLQPKDFLKMCTMWISAL